MTHTKLIWMNWIALVLLLNKLVITCQGVTLCPKPSIFYSHLEGIHCLQIGNDGKAVGNRKTVIPEGKYRNNFHYQIRPIALDVEKERIFWLDFYRKVFYRADLNGQNKEIVLSGVNGVIEGLAYDWISNYIYFTDNTHDWIVVASIDGKYKKILVSGAPLARPRGIAVDPIAGYLFWADSISSRIERCCLDGSQRTTIVSNRSASITDVSIDFRNKRVYYIDLKTNRICSVNYYGERNICEEIYKNSLRKVAFLYSLTHFEKLNTSFFTDILRDNIVSYNHKTSQVDPAVTSPVYVLRYFYGHIRLFDDSVQPKGNRVCDKQCSHFCFKSNSTNFVCDCPLGMVLESNGRSCKKINPALSIYFADSFAGKIFHLTQYEGQIGSKLDALPRPSYTYAYPTSLVYDTTEDMIYWSDLRLQTISRSHPNGSNYAVIVTNVPLVEGMAFDTISRVIFWTNNERDTVEVSKLDGSSRFVLVNTGLSRPRDIEVFPERGLLFVSDWGRVPKVEMMSMDGKNREIIAGGATNIRVYYPNGLTIDKIENKLYYVDAHYDEIMVYELDTKTTHLILSHDNSHDKLGPLFIIFRASSKLEHPYGLTVDKEFLYWTDWKTGGVYRVNKYLGEKVEVVAGVLFRPQDIHAYRLRQTTRYVKKYLIGYPITKCSISCKTEELAKIDIPKCPVGYNDTRVKMACHKCNYSIPTGFQNKCGCNDWASCAYRINENEKTCSTFQPYVHVGVRECTKTIKPGFCPNIRHTCVTRSDECNADQDCLGEKKCCDLGCGGACTSPVKQDLKRDPHPCEKKSRCAHICVSLPNRKYQCLCPPSQTSTSDGIFCPGIDHCQGGGGCQNGGTCINGDRKYCNCTANYTGENCETPIHCKPNPCKNGGRCQNNGTTWRCICPSTTTGKSCEIINYCNASFCNYNGKCMVGSNGTKTCSCFTDYFGPNCGSNSLCVSNPCKNNATCLSDSPFMYKCICPVGFSGYNCDTIDCSDKCQNGGTCIPGANDYRCSCKEGFTGRNCETRKFCHNVTCSYHGACSEIENGYKCLCQSSYTGRNCETFLSCAGVNCGTGQCHPQGLSYYCHCPSDYTGLHCESKIYCKENPCRNQGTCIETVTSYSCNCDPNFTGKNCEVELCNHAKCQNAGFCSSLNYFACTCQQNFALQYCQLYIGKNTVETYLKFRKTSKKQVPRLLFQTVLAKAFSDYCTRDKCPSKNSIQRKRRDSTPSYPAFNSDDVIIPPRYPETRTDDVSYIRFTILVPAAVIGNETAERKLMPVDVILSGFDKSKGFIEDELGVTIVSYKAVNSGTGSLSKRESDDPPVGKSIGIAASVVIILALVLILSWLYKSHRAKNKAAAATVSFSNATFAADNIPQSMDLSQDPRRLPSDAPPTYVESAQPQLSAYDVPFHYLQNPLYNKNEDVGTGDVEPPYFLPKDTKENLSFNLPQYTEPIYVEPASTEEATGFENPLYNLRSNEEFQSAGDMKTAHIYENLEEDENQAKPLPKKLPPLD